MNTLNLNFNSAPAMKISLVTETYLPEVNGVSMTLGRMVEGLLKRQHNVHLVRPRQGKEDKAKQEGLYQETLVSGMPIPGYTELKTGLPAKGKLLKLWQAQRPDIVHIATEGPLGWSAMSAARKLNIPISTDFHTNFHSYTQHYGIGLLQKPIAAYLRHFHNKTDATMVPTHSLKEELEHSGYQNVLVVGRGVATDLFHPSKRSAALRASWGAVEATPVVMLVSRIAAEKNLHVVIRAFEKMRAVQPDAKLVMVGDGPARPMLQLQYPHVIFAGMQTGEALAEHYASGDIFLYSSLTETYGNVTGEAMASGLATLAYDYAAARQHIRHEVNGLLAAFNDEQDFCAQAAALITDAARIERLRVAARASMEMATWDHVIGELESVLVNVAFSKGVKHVSAEPVATTD